MRAPAKRLKAPTGAKFRFCANRAKPPRTVRPTANGLAEFSCIDFSLSLDYPPDRPEAARLGSHKVSGAPATWLAQRLHTNMAALSIRSEEHTSELQSLRHLVCRLLLD